MKKFYGIVAMLIMWCCAVSAQTLLSEDFEGAVFPPEGWEKIDDPQADSYQRWEIVTYGVISGKQSAHVKSPSYFKAEPAKEEKLVTPFVTLDGTYKLQFAWEGATKQSIQDKEYDFQVRVENEAGKTETIWSMIDQQSVVNSGVQWPWVAWTNYTSNVDLSQFKGMKVRIQFVYCLLKGGEGKGNDIWLDNVSIESHNPITTPQIECSSAYYNFPATYLGAKNYSEVLTLKNVGVNVLKIKSVKGLEGTDFGCSIVPENVALAKGDEYQFQLYYEPTLLGKAQTNLEIECNGGENLVLPLKGSKIMLPAGYSYEGFEGNVFPPAGWSKTGDMGWTLYRNGISGDQAAYTALATEASLITPRLDLSGDEEYKVIFDYDEEFTASDDETVEPDSYFKAHLSTDGGASWKELWVNYSYNEVKRVELNLGTPKSDNCLVKFEYSIPGLNMTSYDEVPEYAITYLDNVVLPPLYGAGNPPKAANVVSPQDNAKNVAERRIVLKWDVVQFAEDYKVYCGTANGIWDVADGVSTNNALSYALPNLKTETTYFWKVVPVNSYGEAQDVPVWRFKTQGDQSITTFPYFEGFESGKFAPGWYAINQTLTHWDINDFSAYDGKVCAIATGNSNDSEAILETPNVVLPEGQPLISFYWGNAVAAGLEIDPLGQAKNTTTKETDVDAVYFEVNDGSGWKTLVMLSEKDAKYWYRESIDLSEYAGKTVAMRWRFACFIGTKSHGCALDNITIETVTSDKCLAYFNKNEWYAGKVNYNQSVTSGNTLSIGNGGKETLTVKSVSFSTNKFSADIPEGMTLSADEVKKFSITFNAGKEAAAVEDKMTVEFTNGQTAEFSVSGESLAEDVLYFSFDQDEHGTTSPKGLTTIDYDGLPTVPPTFIYYPNRGSAYAYIVLNVDAQHADWRDVYPRSGDQCLECTRASANNGTTNDWIISPRLKATGQSQFRFWAQGYGNDDQFDKHSIEVRVSEGTNLKAQDEFQVEMSSTMLAWHEWKEYVIDLSKYQGKEIYVALRHMSPPAGFVAFFDDFYYEHFENASQATGIVATQNSKLNTQNATYNLNGQKVSSNYKGIIVKNGIKTIKK